MNAAIPLKTYLLPFENLFQQKGLSEILINKPHTIWIEVDGKFSTIYNKDISYAYLKSLARLIAQSTHQEISLRTPLLSATLPNGFRVQIILPPACASDQIGFAIRKKSDIVFTLDDYEKFGMFDNIDDVQTNKNKNININTLKKILSKKDYKKFLISAITMKKNIIISGGTSTGKTTFANSILSYIPSTERLITVEDAQEIILSKHPNVLHLLSSRGEQGLSKVNMTQLIEACLRLRPNRIIVGELRSKEAFAFLRAINTGHPGSIATLHADSPLMAIEQLKLMVMQAGLNISSEEIKKYILAVVDIIIQLKRGVDNKRYISEIYLNERISS